MSENSQSTRLRSGLGVVALATLVLLAGCASITATSNVAPDGTLTKHQISATMGQNTYSRLDERADRQGYESFCAQLEDRYNESNYDRLSCTKSAQNGNVSVELTLRGYSPPADSRIRVTETDENLTYVDTLESDFDLTRARLTYTVQMPGKIYETNADALTDDNRTAKWTVGEDEQLPARVYAESTIDPGLLGSLPSINLRTVGVTLGVLGLLGYVAYFRSERFENPTISRE